MTSDKSTRGPTQPNLFFTVAVAPKCSILYVINEMEGVQASVAAGVLRGKWALRAAAALQARLREKVGLSVESAGSATIPS